MGLLDFFQGASNAAAGNVSGPVDAIAWALRKAGVPVGDAPMGSSQWMAQMGLTRPANGYAGLLGEAAGLSMPIVAAAKAPQIARGLLSLDDKAMDMTRQGVERAMLANGGIQPATVWHGSPHKFDKFDSSKIGTGEGAQAYGHGLYLADNPEVANFYQDAHNVPLNYLDDYVRLALDMVETNKNGPQWARMTVEQALSNRDRFPDSRVADAALKFIKTGARPASEGNLYKVDLPDEMIGRMLNWDTPLSQQAPSVKAALQKAGIATDEQALGAFDDALLAALNGGPATLPKQPLNLAGETVYRRLGGPDVAAEKLRALGIPGIRYLDGGSRVAGTGTSNYVIFPGNENMLTILERNGQPVSNLGLGK